MNRDLIICGVAALLAGCGDQTAETVIIREASGVVVHDDHLCIVDDSVPGAYFEVPLEGVKPGDVISLNDANPVMVELPRLGIWIDLEAIERLADGRMVVLSERLRSIVGDEGVVAEYDYPLSEVGRRGLEGLAVRPLPDGSSRIAVLWEGGYPDPGSLHPELERRTGGMPFLPLIFVHDLKPGARVDRVRWETGVVHLELDVPKPEGAEPEAQRFRAPDFVWYRQPNSVEDEEWGFIVLLSSQNAVEKRAFLHHWLQRFDASGRPVGEPLDIAQLAPRGIGNANWEGLCWLKAGTSLVLVHEGIGDLTPNALILELPKNWQSEM